MGGPVECMAGDGSVTKKGRDWQAFGGEGSTWRVKDALAVWIIKFGGRRHSDVCYTGVIL